MNTEMNTETNKNKPAPPVPLIKMAQAAKSEEIKKSHPLFPFMAVGSLIYAFFYTLFLYRNNSGITYPFFVGGTCFFFFYYLKKCGLTAKRSSLFLSIAMILLGISTFLTDSPILIFLNKVGIFCLFFYLALHSLYDDKRWNLGTWVINILNIIFSCLEFLPYPFIDLSLYRREKRMEESKLEQKGKYVFYGILIALPLLFVILMLLGTADIVFGDFLSRLLSFDIDEEWLNHCLQIIGLFLFAFFASYCLLCRFSRHDLKEEITNRRTHEPIIAITFTGILSFVYLAFCLIQIVYLFGGMGTLPEGYSYAEYAREGFFQLVFVCLINLSLILLCQKYFRENRALKVLLTFICGCTYIMIASSIYRMLLYISEYHLTFLRVFVLWALAVIILLVSGALVLIYKEDFPLVNYYVMAVTILYLLFSFAKPDYWIARYNLAHAYPKQVSSDGEIFYETDSHSTFYYLDNLSLDAVPAILDKMEEVENSATKDTDWLEDFRWLYADYYVDKLLDSPDYPADEVLVSEQPLPIPQPFWKFNLSRHIACKRFETYYKEYPAFLEYHY